MSKDSAALLDRVRKLLALATSANVHEAASAAAKAQSLIETHRLESLCAAAANEDADPVSDGRTAPLESSRRIRKWKRVLASGLAKNNGCIAYTAQLAGVTQLLIVGRETERLTIAALWRWLVPQIEWLSATHGKGQPRAWHEAFRIGAAETIVRRLEVASLEERTAIGSEALAHIEPTCARRRAAVKNFVDEHLRLQPGRTIRVDREALERGRSLAQNLPVRPR
ncbi:MAG TPA: DUF2786 domain-containing protein [Nannocystis exedens]|nr:DUF2786 domain-containing protein [Nannocystis exedens]